MPKSKGPRRAKKRGESQTPSEEEYDTADNQSTVSVTSEESLIPEEGAGQDSEVDESTAAEDFEDKLKEYIEGTSLKSAQGRKTNLDGLNKCFCKKYLIDFLLDRKVTVSDSVTRCLKKGKGDEQSLAALCISLLCVQLGQESESIVKELQPLIQTIMLDNSVAIKARSQCATCLAVTCFIASDDIEKTAEIMGVLEDVFKNSYRKGDNSIPNTNTELCKLHASALSAWSLLLSIAPPFLVDKLVKRHLGKLPDLLLSQDVELRITAGESIAMLYELAREEDDEFEGEDMEELCESLKKLATDGNKYRAKKDRRQQRSSFRDILRSVEEFESPEYSITFGKEFIYIDSWTKKKQYDMFCQILGSGVNLHLRENDLIREVFGLGAPIPPGTIKPQKGQKLERQLYNAAVFKARTKARAKHRDKRTVTANGF